MSSSGARLDPTLVAATVTAELEGRSLVELDQDGKVPEDVQPERLSAVALAAEFALRPDNDSRAVGKGELVVNVTDYGATGVSGHDDLAAFNSALAAAGAALAFGSVTVRCPYTSDGYSLSGSPTIPSGITIRGERDVKLTLTAAVTNWLDFAGLTGTTIEGFTIDLRGYPTAAGVRMTSTSVNCVSRRNTYTSTRHTTYTVTNKALTSNVATLTIGAHAIQVGDVVMVYGVNGTSATDAGKFNGGTTTITAVTGTTISYAKTNADIASAAASGYVTVNQLANGVYCINMDSAVRCASEDDTFDTVRAGIRVYQGTVSCRIRRPTFTSWGDRGIFVLGTATGNSVDLLVDHPVWGPPSQQWGDPHQPFAVQGVAGYWHDNIRVLFPTVDGATSGGNLIGHHTGKSNNDLLGGTADALSFHHTKNLHVHGPTIRNTGEVGVTISNDCTLFTISDVVVDGANSVGVAFDWGSGASFIGSGLVHDISVKNAGQERGQAATGDARRAGTSSAVWLAGTSDVQVRNVSAVDDQGTPTMTSVYYIKDTTTNLKLGPDLRSGGCTLLTNASSVSTSGQVDYAPTALPTPEIKLTQTSGDLTLPQSDATNYTDVPGMTATVPVGTYAVTCYVEYEAATAADCQFKWGVTGLTASGSWSLNGLLIGATTTVGSIQRLANAWTGSPTAGGAGVGTKCTASPSGTLVVGAGGTFKLTATQGTADASDVKIRNCWAILKPL